MKHVAGHKGCGAISRRHWRRRAASRQGAGGARMLLQILSLGSPVSPNSSSAAVASASSWRRALAGPSYWTGNRATRPVADPEDGVHRLLRPDWADWQLGPCRELVCNQHTNGLDLQLPTGRRASPPGQGSPLPYRAAPPFSPTTSDGDIFAGERTAKEPHPATGQRRSGTIQRSQQHIQW